MYKWWTAKMSPLCKEAFHLICNWFSKGRHTHTHTHTYVLSTCLPLSSQSNRWWILLLTHAYSWQIVPLRLCGVICERWSTTEWAGSSDRRRVAETQTKTSPKRPIWRKLYIWGLKGHRSADELLLSVSAWTSRKDQKTCETLLPFLLSLQWPWWIQQYEPLCVWSSNTNSINKSNKNKLCTHKSQKSDMMISFTCEIST